MRFEFATATRIVFGAGTLPQAADAAAQWGRHALLVTPGDAEQIDPLPRHLAERGIAVTLCAVTGEPTVASVAAGVRLARDAACDLVIGCGGGSVIDTAKAIALLRTNDGDPLDYLEVIGHGRTLSVPAAPCIAIPTTAGTGAEVTRNAVLGSPAHRVKVSLRSPLMLPRLAVVDPELTYSLPRDITAATGLDALTQLLEPYVCAAPNPLTDALCREGLVRVARALRRVCADGHDVSGREDMALASLFGGLALANAKLGAVHGLAGPLGGMFPAPHGAVCAALLPHVMAVNLASLRRRSPGHPALDRYEEAARLLTGSAAARADDGVAWVAQLVRALDIPALSRYGVTAADGPALIGQAQRASSMQGNPIRLEADELADVLRRAL
ncbi:MAG: iron-containing alcohol dehydrogenase [Pirellulaceae bacterium]|jgi:alcohol dehydrogenase class IV|nr:iron-containing alcohol dehydrogenase [Pirellulaceae bacterium]